jgi:hypothetical protein
MVHTVSDVEPGSVVAKSEPDDMFGWASRSSILIPEDDRFMTPATIRRGTKALGGGS